MKKRLEADLISIAHRILQLKNRSEINQLYLETQKLYEKLAVLRFVDEHFGEAKPTIGQAEIVEKMKQFFEDNKGSEFDVNSKPAFIEIEENTTAVTLLEPEIEEEILVEVEVPVFDEIEESNPEADNDTEPEEITLKETLFTPSFDLVEEAVVDVQRKQDVVQISFEDLLDGNFDDSMFVKVNQIENIPTAIAIEPEIISNLEEEMEAALSTIDEIEEQTPVAANEKSSKGLTIDLNDRIGFIKHLFGNDTEDYNRVLNQLITFDSFEETQSFIDDMVKPDYNNWEGKEDYVERFMTVIEKKFANQKETK